MMQAIPPATSQISWLNSPRCEITADDKDDAHKPQNTIRQGKALRCDKGASVVRYLFVLKYEPDSQAGQRRP
jgi:predicted exporter